MFVILRANTVDGIYQVTRQTFLTLVPGYLLKIQGITSQKPLVFCVYDAIKRLVHFYEINKYVCYLVPYDERNNEKDA